MSVAISILVAVHNEADHIEDALASIFREQLVGTEIVIVDDASQDATGKIIADLARNAPVPITHIRHDTNRGLAAARNTALAAAKGDYAILLDGDDCFAPGAIGHLIERLEAMPGGSLIFPRHQWIAQDGSMLPSQSPAPRRPVTIADIVLANPIHSDSGIAARCADIAAAGGFDERLTGYVGADFLIRYALTHGETGIRSERGASVLYRRHEAQITADWQRMDRNWRILADTLQRRAASIYGPIEQRAEMRHRLYCSHIAYRAGDYRAARRFVFSALAAEPKQAFASAELRRQILAGVASLLPEPVHAALRRRFGPGSADPAPR